MAEGDGLDLLHHHVHVDPALLSSHCLLFHLFYGIGVSGNLSVEILEGTCLFGSFGLEGLDLSLEDGVLVEFEFEVGLEFLL